MSGKWSFSSVSSSFVPVAVFTIALTYVLISVGAIVRVSGAGMGCPDWPRCFGLLIPPLSVDQLPPLGTYAYPKGWTVESFDPLMTWIEFLNRLLGMVVGFAILGTLVSALRSHRRRPGVMWPVVGAFVGVLYAAWLGGRVVAHELAPWIVTVHLLSAIAVVSLLIVAAVNATTSAAANTPGTPGTPGTLVARSAWAVVGLGLVQGTLGTQVRGLLEDIARSHAEWGRGDWIDSVGLMDTLHRSAAVVVVAGVIALAFLARTRLQGQGAVNRAASAAVALVVLQMVIGVVLAEASLPRVAQVLHLLVGALLLGALTTTAMFARAAPLQSDAAAG